MTRPLIRTLFLALAFSIPTGLGAQVDATLNATLAPFETLLGTWEAEGEGFRTVLEYRAGTTGRVVYANNVVYGADGALVARYEGWYVADQEKGITFETRAASGEVHAGIVRVLSGGLTHEASVEGGMIDGYRSLIRSLAPDVFEYRAVYRLDASVEEVEGAAPLTYRRILGTGDSR